MRIVPQSVTVSYSPFPTVPLLSAPRIAGLLPARCPTPEDYAYVDPEPYFIFSDPRLAKLSDEQRERLFEANRTLLQVALAFATGTMTEESLRAAEVVFHRAAGGKSVVRPLSPRAYNADLTADKIEWAAGAAQRVATAYEQAKRDAKARWGELGGEAGRDSDE